MKKLKRMNQKTIKAWTIVWTQKGMKDYGVKDKDRIISEILYSENSDDGFNYEVKKNRSGKKLKYKITALAIFQTKRKADIWNKKEGGDFKVIPIEICLKKRGQ